MEDLFSSEVSRENRHVVFYFIKCIIVGQYETLGVMRKHIFNFIKSHNIVEDLSCRLNIVLYFNIYYLLEFTYSHSIFF